MRLFGQKNEEDDEEAGKAAEAKFNATVSEAVKKAVGEVNTENKSTLESLAASIKQMNDRSAAEEAERIKRKKAEEQKPAPTAEEQFEMMANDPEGFVRKQLEPATRLSMLTMAKQVRGETLGGKPYYHGEFKKKVDDIIDAHSNLQDRCNPQFCLNCYKIVLADHMQEINEGKLTQFHSFADGGSGGKKGTESDKNTVDYRDAKSKWAAAQMGLTDDDIISAAKDQVIRGLELVA